VRGIDEMHEQRAPRANPLDRRRLGAEPAQARVERGNGDVQGFGAHGAGIVLPSARRVVETNQEEHMTLTIWDRIENARERWNVLRHPFYQRWTAGELTSEELARYSGQYRHAVEAIADVSEDAAAGRPDLAEHAVEEREHLALWDGFIDATGGDAAAEPTPETAECVKEWTAGDDTLAKLVTLYAIEAAQPEISRVKREGLLSSYGFEDGDGTEYFRLHEQRDAEHAAEARHLLAELADEGDEDRLVAVAEGAYRANWRLLDGV
jgi:pyrroloquinoline-quinone synthase